MRVLIWTISRTSSIWSSTMITVYIELTDVLESGMVLIVLRIHQARK